jgi:nicotinamidase/pyrazinamidase
MRKALIIVDMQNDYCCGGPMAFKGSLKIIPEINRIRDNFDFTIFIKDLHPENHSSFKSNGGKFVRHCVINTFGSEIHKDITVKQSDFIINRGTQQEYDSDSIFFDAYGIDKMTNLKNILLVHKIAEIYFCGNGLDSVIFSSVIDAINFKFKCFIFKEATTHENEVRFNECTNYLKNLNVELI